ncbi:MAG TPA: cytochrome c biogenesis CcdA family protein [Solirubrobacteraceae bacterium]
MLGPSLLFVSSLSATFILLGLGATSIGSTLNHQRATLEKVSAVLIVAMGALFLLGPYVAGLNRELHVGALTRRAGRDGPVVAGAAFAIAWTPCVGQTLGAILAAAALSQSAGHAAVLLGFDSAGLAIPFLATALAFQRMTVAFDVVKRHYRVLLAAGGAVLIVMGYSSGPSELFQLNVQAQHVLDDLGLNFFNEI